MHGDSHAGHESGAIDELQKFRRLIDDPADFFGLVQRAIGQAAVRGWFEISLGGGDGIAMRVNLGVIEQRVDFGQDFFADGVLQFLGFGVDFGPIEAEDSYEEEFDEAMSAEDVEGELLAAAREADAAARGS